MASQTMLTGMKFPITGTPNSHATQKFHEFSMIWAFFQIPWFFQVWKMLFSFSRFSMTLGTLVFAFIILPSLDLLWLTLHGTSCGCASLKSPVYVPPWPSDLLCFEPSRQAPAVPIRSCRLGTYSLGPHVRLCLTRTQCGLKVLCLGADWIVI